MSRRNKKKVENPVDTKDVTINETKDEKETDEMKEKKSFWVAFGETAGKAVNFGKKVVTSKPAKAVAVLGGIGTAIAVGYKLGKDGLPELPIGGDFDDDFNEEIDSVVEDDTSSDVETEEN